MARLLRLAMLMYCLNLAPTLFKFPGPLLWHRSTEFAFFLIVLLFHPSDNEYTDNLIARFFSEI